MYGSNYIPDEKKMKENQLRFRYWHVESLLNQAANLADQCLKDLDECMQLEIVEFTSNHEAEMQAVETGNARNRTDIFERLLIETQSELELYSLSNQHFYNAKFAANDLHDLPGDAATKYAHIQSIQNKEQFAVAEIEREQRRLMLQKKLEWYTEDAEKDEFLGIQGRPYRIAT